MSGDDIGGLSIDQKGKLLASGDDNGEINVIDLESSRLSLSFAGHKNLCTSVAFSPYAENELFSCGMDCCVTSWNLDSKDVFWTESMEFINTKSQTVNPPMLFDMAVPETSMWTGLLAAARGDGSIFIKIESEEEHMSGYASSQDCNI